MTDMTERKLNFHIASFSFAFSVIERLFLYLFIHSPFLSLSFRLSAWCTSDQDDSSIDPTKNKDHGFKPISLELEISFSSD